MAFTEFYMQSGGSNLNAGSTNGALVYTSAGGDWVNATRVFTPTDGQTTSSLVAVGDFASVYVTAGATATAFIGRVTVVGAGTNGTITISSTISYGTNPSNSSGAHTITLTTGGAWAGPGTAVTFPFALSGNSIGTLVNTSSNFVRVNIKNDQTYTMTSALTFNAVGKAILQGYTSSTGDGGRATFTSNVTGSDNFQLGGGNGSTNFIDLVFASTAASGSSNVFGATVSNSYFFLRSVFHGGRLHGLANATGWMRLYECEAYDNNKSSASDAGGFQTNNSSPIAMVLYNCYSHDNNGTGGHGYYTNASGMLLFNCIADSNGGKGFKFDSTSASATSDFVNCNFYNNTSDAITYSNGASGMYAYIANNNFVKNGGKGINVTTTGQPGIIYNNGRGSGTQANGSADALSGLVDTSTDITYASNLTPWNAPTTGDFRTNLSTANFAGRQAFTETDGTNTGTIGYPDIGAAQSKTGPGGTFSKEVSYGSSS